MAKPLRKLIRRIKRAHTVRKRRNQAKIRLAKKAAAAQTRITRDSRTTAGELRASGAFEWQGSGMPDTTVMQPVRAEGGGWEWVPVTNRQGQPVTRRPAALKNAANVSQKCGAPTKDKTPCERLGDCPIRSHQAWRKANR